MPVQIPLQVATKLPCLAQKDPLLDKLQEIDEAMAKFFTARAEGSQSETVSKEMQATELMADETRQWLEGLSDRVRALVAGGLQSRLQRARDSEQTASELLSEVPVCDKEPEYRQKLAKLSSRLASEAVKLRRQGEELAATGKVLSGSSEVADAEETARRLHALAQLCQTHVTFLLP